MLGEMLVDKSVLLRNVGHACRSLFGPVDHDEVRKTLQRELREINQRSSDRWNFDFKRELPLPGRWKYEEVDEVPSAYNMPQLSLKVDIIRDFKSQQTGVMVLEPESASGETDTDSESSPVATRLSPAVETRDCCSPVPTDSVVDSRIKADLPPQTNAAATQTSPQKRKRQQQITDFFPQKKMARTEESKPGAQ